MLAQAVSESDLFRRISLTGSFYSRQNSNSQEYDRAHDNPMRGHVHQVRAIDQSDEHDREPNRVKAERHGISLFPTGCQSTRLAHFASAVLCINAHFEEEACFGCITLGPFRES
jgi:hypothetical protein